MKRPLEMSLRMSVGAKKKVFDKRNGIPAASLGDKSYQVPEYSMEFHKQGSTRPVISFGNHVILSLPSSFQTTVRVLTAGHRSCGDWYNIFQTHLSHFKTYHHTQEYHLRRKRK
ncbi:uncharacterized protein [Montipora capricornis]|uniref:uncharacterized protein isoform X1 n=1 Tax=Montipora capricornis TaxID=246305 RepID=UPI0035F1A1DE